MNVSDQYVQDIYYYADHYNYTQDYLQNFGLNQQISFIAGICYILFAGISFTLYTRLLIIIFYDKKINHLPAYRIILQNGYADLLMLALWVLMGIMSISLSTFHEVFAKISGAMCMFGIHSSSSFTLLLSLNRFVQIVLPQQIDNYFDPKLTKIYIIICWLTSLPMPILSSFTTLITFRYYPYWNGWGYATVDNARRVLFANINNYIPIAKITISTTLYIIMILHMICRKQHMSKTEVRLTIQTMVDVILRMSGYIYDIFFAASVYDTGIESIVDYSLIFLANTINAYIYLTFNTPIRKQFVPNFLRKHIGKHKSTTTNIRKDIMVQKKQAVTPMAHLS